MKLETFAIVGATRFGKFKCIGKLIPGGGFIGIGVAGSSASRKVEGLSGSCSALLRAAAAQVANCGKVPPHAVDQK